MGQQLHGSFLCRSPFYKFWDGFWHTFPGALPQRKLECTGTIADP